MTDSTTRNAVPDWAKTPGFSFGLYDTTTEELVVALEPGVVASLSHADVAGRSLAFVARAEPPFEGSIRITADGRTQIENIAPYAQFGDDGGDLLGGVTLGEGIHTAVFEIFSGRKGRGELLESVTLGVTVEAPEPQPEPENAAPVAIDDSSRVEEGGSVLIDVLANDNDPDGDAIAIDGIVQPQPLPLPQPRAEPQPDPEPDGSGLSFGLYDTTTEELAARLEPGTVARLEHADVEGRLLAFVAGTETPIAGSVRITADGRTQVENLAPYAQFGDASGDLRDGVVLGSGVHTAFFEVFSGPDASGRLLERAFLGVTVAAPEPEPENAAPVAVDDSSRVDEGGSVLIDVLANDSDPDGDALTITRLDEPENGMVSLEDDQILFSPDEGFIGTETIGYTVSDGRGGSDTATVTVIVAPAPMPEPGPGPGFRAEGFVLAANVRSLSEIDFSAVPDAVETVPALDHRGGHDLFWQGGPADNFAMRYTAVLSVETAGTYTFFLASDDGSRLAIDGVTAIDNDGPHATVERTVSLALEAGAHALDVLYFENTGAQTLALEWSGPDTGGSRTLLTGTAVGLPAETPDPDPEPENAAPAAVDDSSRVDEGGSVLINVLDNDSDPDGDTLTITLLEEPDTGMISLEDDQILFTPAEGFSGTATFDYAISDGRGGTDTATVTVAVEAAPDPEAPMPPDGTGTGVGLASPSLAMGLNGVTDWSTQQPFLDVMKTSRTWLGHTQSQFGAWKEDDLAAGGYLDANGWPVAIPDGVRAVEALILTNMPIDSTALAGRYVVRYEGAGTLDVVGARVSNVEQGDGEIRFDYTPGKGFVALAITDTDPAGTGDHIRDITVVKEEHLELHEAGGLFNPVWIDHIEDMRTLRFMDWMETNNSDQSAWEDRPQVDDHTWTAAGVPVEIMVALANQVGADPWFTIPHQADDAYIREFATYVRDHLDPDLKAHVEYSNEVWNWGFDQASWAADQAEARWGPDLPGDAWLQFYGVRAAETATIWDEVFGAAAGERVVNVIATQTAVPGREQAIFDAPLHVAAGGQPPVQSFDAYAVTGYFGHDLGRDSMVDTVHGWIAESEAAAMAEADAQGLTGADREAYVEAHRFDLASQRAAADLLEGDLGTLIAEKLPYHGAVAAEHGLDLIMYEGGTHIVGIRANTNDELLTEFFTHFNYTAEMAGLYEVLLEGWRDAGGTLFNAFVDVSAPSKWGSWGHLRHLDDDNPRWDAIEAYNTSTEAWWETRAEGAFDHGVLRTGTEGDDILFGTGEEDMLLGRGGNDVLFGNGRGDGLHGGEGQDTAVLPGSADNYVFSQDGAAVIAVNPHGTTTLVDIESIIFEDDPATEIAIEILIN